MVDKYIFFVQKKLYAKKIFIQYRSFQCEKKQARETRAIDSGDDQAFNFIVIKKLYL